MLRHYDHPGTSTSLQFRQPLDKSLRDLQAKPDRMHPGIIAEKMLQLVWKGFGKRVLKQMCASSPDRRKLVEVLPQP